MVKRAPARSRPRKAKPGTKGLGPAECRLDQPTGTAAEAAEAIAKVGGCVVGSYKEPLGGHPVLLSILPIDAVERTPFQRDLSDAHHKRLADVINKGCSLIRFKYVRSNLGFGRQKSDSDFSFDPFCVRATDSESVARQELQPSETKDDDLVALHHRAAASPPQQEQPAPIRAN